MRVYILGAGASRHAGYPLVSTMAADALAWMQTQPLAKLATEGLIERFGASPNIEELLTFLDAQIKALDTDRSEDRMDRVRFIDWLGTLRTCLREWFREIHDQPATAYAQFAKSVVQPGDVVVTFNYDDSLERELWRAGKWDVRRGYGFPVGAEAVASETLVLKLHGSINWLASIFNGMKPGSFSVGTPGGSLGGQPVIHEADLRYLGYQEVPSHSYHGGGGAFPALIMPMRAKQFYFQTSFGQEWNGFWDGLWSRARRALGAASEIIVCGYSLLPVDERARELILNSPAKTATVTVVSGGDTERIAADFRQSGFTNLVAGQARYFEEWVKVMHQHGG